MPSKDVVNIAGLRVSKRRFKKRVYWGISILIVVLFMSTLVYQLLFGRQA